MAAITLQGGSLSHRALGTIVGLLSVAFTGCGGESRIGTSPDPATDRRASLRGTLDALGDQAADPLFRLHFRSMVRVIEAGDRGSSADSQLIDRLWAAFKDAGTPKSPRLAASYLDRSRPLIVAWVSPTDGQVSFAWLTLPARWDAAAEYPLYVQLHGFWDVAQERLSYLAYPFSNPGTSYAFEDGYLLSPWGRGNQWYRGVAETDIWEGVTVVESLLRVDPTRKYLCGHSMGGYGAWHIAQRSPDVWAALGIHAGALGYDMTELAPDAVSVLRAMPTYFVVGTADGLLGVNQIAYGRLRDAGNPQLEFVTFPGGHEYRAVDVEQMYLWLRRFTTDVR